METFGQTEKPRVRTRTKNKKRNGAGNEGSKIDRWNEDENRRKQGERKPKSDCAAAPDNIMQRPNLAKSWKKKIGSEKETNLGTCQESRCDRC